MTTVAWDGTTLAADRRTNFGSLHGESSKIHRMKDGRLVAGCGMTALIWEMVAWLDAGADPDKLPAAQRSATDCASMLVVGLGGELDLYENGPIPVRLCNFQWSIGSGRDFATTAMHLGRTAAEAVHIAALFDNSTGNGVDEAQPGLPTVLT